MDNDETDFYDMRWGLFSWASVANDYVLNYKLQPQVQNLGELLSLLNEINKVTVGAGNLIFDGTLSSLFYLINNGKLKLGDIKDERLKKTINETLEEVKKGTLPKISTNRWSRIALVSKANFVGLHLYTGILQVPSTASHIIETFEKLTDRDFPIFDDDLKYLPEDSHMRLTSINAMWISLASMKPWNKNLQQDMNQFFINELVLSYSNKTPIGKIFQLLQPHIDSVALKFFPKFHIEDHSACTAVRQAAIFVAFNTMNILKKENRHKEIRIDGMFHKWIEYVYDENNNLQAWFIDYVKKEMEPRIEFIRYLSDEKVLFEFDEEMVKMFEDLYYDKTRVKRTLYYLPIFESFRVANPTLLPLYKKIITIFHNRTISTEIKDLMYRKMVMNIQKLVTYKPRSVEKGGEESLLINQEKEMKELLFLLLFEAMKPLIMSITGRIVSIEDIRGIVDNQFFLTLLKYDSSKNSSFLGYMKSMLILNLKSELREKKINTSSSSINEKEDLIADPNFDIERQVQDELLKTEFHKCIDKLPEKEKEAVIKALEGNKNMSASERKAKSRAFQKLKKIPELRLLLTV